MNWYTLFKLSAYQPVLPFEETLDTYSGYLDSDLENATSKDEVERILTYYGIDYDEIEFPESAPVIIYKSKVAVKDYFGRESYPLYVIDDFDFVSSVPAQEWIDNINSMYLDDYLNFPDKGDEFWSYPSVVYHATDSSNVERIMSEGLFPRSESRGLSNRDMDSAIFTSLSPDVIDSYGDTIIAINAPQMKADGYTPDVEAETPLVDSEKRSAIANLIGFDEYVTKEYSGEGYDYDTLAFYGVIPPKYLEVLD